MQLIYTNISDTIAEEMSALNCC